MKTAFLVTNLLLWLGFFGFILYEAYDDIRAGRETWKSLAPTAIGDFLFLGVILFEIIGSAIAIVL